MESLAANISILLGNIWLCDKNQHVLSECDALATVLRLLNFNPEMYYVTEMSLPTFEVHRK